MPHHQRSTSAMASWTLESARQLVDDFERGILPKEKWTHEAHCITALIYCSTWPLALAMEKIRTNIKRYNETVGGHNTDTSGYHETITQFYMGTIAQYLLHKDLTQLTGSELSCFLTQPFLDKGFPLQFYTVECLMSKEARLQWQAPDKSNS